ncbi:Gfo/Idh/MocA family oxidoreductase [Paenibacillus sp. MWE-103]|uniref:Gfo/Idh/MocA family oxidoreductase n=1 Tax=Paenibacillus artemisiicola TaxID=1172618 RepID=A0ABS3W3W8_9BACL|nr:Gfo/Idh/MocA family oxidoreductase [Paenibacillus artemisiicola]MBO7742994.1 Gfo/Idh/MocA family oxidoreductase [Paenibacillus artemisiicola]
MKVGVVGCGGMGHVHARSYANMKEAELVGVCDLDAELAEELARETGTRAFASFEAMLEAADPEAVSIALPSYLHKEAVLKAAAAGKHVICEKPVALTLEETDEMIAACEAQGVRLFIGHVVRFFPEYEQLKRDVDAGRIGEPGVAHAKRAGSHPGRWFKDEALSGGVIVDMMIHDIDFMRWAFGEVKSVFAMNKANAEMDYALVTLQFRSGAAANLEAFWGDPGSFRYSAELAGSKGLIRLDSAASASLHVRASAARRQDSPFAEIPKSPGAQSPFERELAHFLACIRDGAEPRVTARDAREALRIALAALASVRTGQAIEL